MKLFGVFVVIQAYDFLLQHAAQVSSVVCGGIWVEGKLRSVPRCTLPFSLLAVVRRRQLFMLQACAGYISPVSCYWPSGEAQVPEARI